MSATMKKACLSGWFGALVLAASACAAAAEPPAPPAPPAPAAQQAVAVPAVSRNWHGNDYRAFAQALETGSQPLPRNDTATGAALIARLSAVDNLELQANRALPIAPRMEDFLVMQQSVVPILMRYLQAASRGEPVHAELASMLSFALRLAGSGAALTEEFLPQIPHDETYAVRMQGFAKVKSGLTTVLDGAENSLSETEFYSPADISGMLEAMAAALPSMKNLLAPDFRAELRARLEHRRQAATRAEDQRNLDRMLAELAP
jgi:hypothetical protein